MHKLELFIEKTDAPEKTVVKQKAAPSKISWKMRLALHALVGGTVLLGSATQSMAQAKKPPIATINPELKEKQECEKMIQELEEKYHIEIGYNHFEESNLGQNTYFTVETADWKEIRQSLIDLEKEIKKYPTRGWQKAMKTFGPLKIYLFRTIKDEEGYEVGTVLGNEIYLETDQVHNSFDHELVHFFDIKNGNNDKIHWAAAHPEGKNVYIFENGRDAIHSEAYHQARSHLNGMRISGFADIYGQYGGLLEDAATMGANLLNSRKILDLLDQAQTDKPVREHIEMMTGCIFDIETGKFSKSMTREEYTKRFGFDDYEYYAQWFADEKGKMTMDHHYWNFLINCAHQLENDRYDSGYSDFNLNLVVNGHKSNAGLNGTYGGMEMRYTRGFANPEKPAFELVIPTGASATSRDFSDFDERGGWHLHTGVLSGLALPVRTVFSTFTIRSGLEANVLFSAPPPDKYPEKDGGPVWHDSDFSVTVPFEIGWKFYVNRHKYKPLDGPYLNLNVGTRVEIYGTDSHINYPSESNIPTIMQNGYANLGIGYTMP